MYIADAMENIIGNGDEYESEGSVIYWDSDSGNVSIRNFNSAKGIRLVISKDIIDRDWSLVKSANKEFGKIKVINMTDEDEFQETVNDFLGKGWVISSTACGFINSETYDFCTSFQAILIKGE